MLLGAKGKGLAIAALAFAAVSTVNAMSILDDARRDGLAIPTLRPFVEEYSSAVGLVMALAVVWRLIDAAMARPEWLRRLLLLSGAALAFSALHIAAMLAIRYALWGAVGDVYRFDLTGDWFYEFRKDVLAFGMCVVLHRLVCPPGRGGSGRVTTKRELATIVTAVPLLALRDGARDVPVRAGTVVAAEAQGNYVEIHQTGGERQLLRCTLADAEARLAPDGLVRCHRSWLVAPSCVDAMTSTGQGDYQLTVAGRLRVPLSRRFVAEFRRRTEPAIRARRSAKS